MGLITMSTFPHHTRTLTHPMAPLPPPHHPPHQSLNTRPHHSHQTEQTTTPQPPVNPHPPTKTHHHTHQPHPPPTPNHHYPTARTRPPQDPPTTRPRPPTPPTNQATPTTNQPGHPHYPQLQHDTPHLNHPPRPINSTHPRPTCIPWLPNLLPHASSIGRTGRRRHGTTITDVPFLVGMVDAEGSTACLRGGHWRINERSVFNSGALVSPALTKRGLKLRRRGCPSVPMEVGEDVHT